jgi:hypothetical protein
MAFKLNEPIVPRRADDRPPRVFVKPVAVVYQIIKPGVNADKAIEKMGDDMEKFAGVAAFDSAQVVNGLKAGLLEFIDKFPESRGVGLETFPKSGFKPFFRSGEAAFFLDIDSVIADQKGVVKEVPHLGDGILQRRRGDENEMAGYELHRVVSTIVLP